MTMIPLELIALYLLHALLCGAIVGAVICRVDTMNRKHNKLSWWVMYMAYAVFAFLALVHALVAKAWEPAYLLGLAALALNLWLTRKSWPNKPPPLSCRPGCEL